MQEHHLSNEEHWVVFKAITHVQYSIILYVLKFVYCYFNNRISFFYSYQMQVKTTKTEPKTLQLSSSIYIYNYRAMPHLHVSSTGLIIQRNIHRYIVHLENIQSINSTGTNNLFFSPKHMYTAKLYFPRKKTRKLRNRQIIHEKQPPLVSQY